MSFQSIRRYFYELHLWLGIVSGIIVFVVCLSGAVLVFQDEARQIAEPSKYLVKVPADVTPIQIDELIAKVETAKPDMKVGMLTIPEKKNRTVIMALTPVVQEEQEEIGQRPEGIRGDGRGERGQRPEGMRGEGRGERPEGMRGEGRGERGQGPQRGMENRQGRPGESPKTSGPGGHGARGRNNVYVNPYTGDIAGEGTNVVDPFFMSTMLLHRFLWFSGQWTWVGKQIVGWATLIFIVVCLTGIVLWLPRTWSAFGKWKAWKPGLKIRFKKGIWPFLYDTHNTVGIYMLVPALILALTGLCWSFAWYRDGASQVLGDQVFKQRMQRPEMIEPVANDATPFDVGEILAKQEELTPGPGEIMVSIPQDKESAMVVQKGRTGFFSVALKDKTQWDRFRGTVIPVEHFGKTVAVERFADKPFGAQIASSIRALHLGNVTGMSSKILFFIACIFATSWPATGVALWVKKLRVKRAAKKRAEKSEVLVPPQTESPVKASPAD